MKPERVIIDFEKAEELAFRENLGDVAIHGCYFYFGQSIWRKIQGLGMASRYGNDIEYNRGLKKFIALAFCDKDDVFNRYEFLAAQFLDRFGDSNVHQDFLEYYENTWVGRPRRNPLFGIAMWNCKEITEEFLPRTNNSVESWHHAFQQAVGCHHPTFFKFMDALIKEQLRVNAIFIRLEAGEQVPLYSRVEYRQANERLLALINDYDNKTVDDFFTACSYYCMLG